MDAKTEELRASHDVLPEWYVANLVWGSTQTDADTSTAGQEAARQSLTSALNRWFGAPAVDRTTGSADAQPLVPSATP